MRKIGIEKKDQSYSPAWHLWSRKLQLTALIIMTFLACRVTSAKTSRLYPPSKDEAGALRVTQVTELGTREEILRLTTNLPNLLASGLKDSDLKDGSIAIGRVYCCHESTERGTEVWFYVPPDVSLKVGDIVVIRMGRESTKTDPGAVNVATGVREKAGAPDPKCSWDPPNNKLWMRVIYCTWMPTEGWTLKTGFQKTWLKRASEAKTQ